LKILILTKISFQRNIQNKTLSNSWRPELIATMKIVYKLNE